MAEPPPAVESDLPSARPASRVSVTPETISGIWSQVLQQLSDMTSANAEMSERVAICAPNRLVVSFRPKYTSCKSFCERPEQAARLEKALLEATGTPLKLEFALLEDAPEERPPAEARPAAVSPRERLVEKANHPFVKRAAELFNAHPVRVEES